MSKQNNIWSKLSTALFVVSYTTFDDLKEYKAAIRSVNLNIHDCIILAIVKTKKEKDVLNKEYNVVFISEQDFNIFGVLKNQEVKKILSRSYDMIFYCTEVSNKIDKLFKNMKKNIFVGVNCALSNQKINLKTHINTPSHLINFTKETLEKIV